MPQYGMPVYTTEELLGPSYTLVTFAWFSARGKGAYGTCCSGVGMGTDYPCHCSAKLRNGKLARVQQHQAAGNGEGAEESQLNPTIVLAPQVVLIWCPNMSQLGHSVGDDRPYPWTIHVWFSVFPGLVVPRNRRAHGMLPWQFFFACLA